MRHFTELSTLNYGVDSGPYPLGSCTMKYNPKVNERLAALEGFSGLHPYEPEALVQGALELMHTLEGWLAEIAGLSRRPCSRRPAPTASSRDCCSSAPTTRPRDGRRARSSSPTRRTAPTRPRS